MKTIASNIFRVCDGRFPRNTVDDSIDDKFEKYLKEKLETKDDFKLHLSFSCSIKACNNSERYLSKVRTITQADPNKPKLLSDLNKYYTVRDLDEELEIFKDGGIMKIKRLAFNDTLEEHQFTVNFDNEKITARGCR